MPASRTISPGDPATLGFRDYPARAREGFVPGAVVARPQETALIALPAGAGAQPAPGYLTSIEVKAGAAVPPGSSGGSTVKLDLRKYTLIRAAHLPDFSA